jgi:outer membrane receptor protein involved in Fe transport
MFKKIVFIAGLLVATGQLCAQTNKISGKITDENKQHMPYATVALVKLPNATHLKTIITDTAGNFAFSNIAKGTYLVKTTAMGYKIYNTESFVHDGLQAIDFGEFLMEPVANTLATVTVSGKKPLVEQSIDKMTINIANSILAEGSNALELLAKAPGVAVNDDGNISLKGRPGTLVLLNGKQTYLSAKELGNLLKGTSSSTVQKIEIMSNPSSKYDAAGNGGIINIVMKKKVALGFNGTATINGGSGRNARYGGGGSLNYRASQFNVYGSYNYAYRGETEYLDFVRNFYNQNSVAGLPNRTSYQDTKTNEPLHTHNFRAGADYFLDDKNTIGFLLNGNTGKYTHDSRTSNILRDNQTSTIISDAMSHNYDKQSWENLSYNLNYLHQFNKEGQTLNIDADYASNTFNSQLNLNTRYKGSSGNYDGQSSNRRGYAPSLTNVYVGKVDYAHPLGEKLKLETGLKSSFVNADNNLRYDTLQNNTWVKDANSSSHFKYQEQIHAGYLSLNNDFKYFSLQVGLRAEYTNSRGHQITSDSLVHRSYFQLFPSVFITKPMSQHHQLQLAYSRRIERPSYDDLNPFRVFRDPFLFYQGNPFLRPELTGTLQLSHSYKQKYITAVSYNRTKHVINWAPGQIDSLSTTFSQPINLKSFVNYGISFTISADFLNWWTGTHFANFYHNAYKGEHQGKSFDNALASFSLNTQNTFKLGSGYSAELSAFYEAKSVYGISSQKAFYAVSAGFQKNMFNQKATLKLLINDIFQTVKYRRTSQFDNIDMKTNIFIDSRRAILSFSYNFGNQDIKRRDRKAASEDEQGRVKGS